MVPCRRVVKTVGTFGPQTADISPYQWEGSTRITLETDRRHQLMWSHSIVQSCNFLTNINYQYQKTNEKIYNFSCAWGSISGHVHTLGCVHKTTILTSIRTIDTPTANGRFLTRTKQWHVILVSRVLDENSLKIHLMSLLYSIRSLFSWNKAHK